VELLKIDEQTSNDLAIFGRPGKSSVYDLYNKTSTQGGGARLALLFKAPLADAAEINARAELYRFFSLHGYVFPIDAATVGAVAYYLENEDVRSQLQGGRESISSKFKQMVAADADFVFVRDGVQATLRLFYEVRTFLKGLDGEVKGGAGGTRGAGARSEAGAKEGAGGKGSPYAQQYDAFVQLLESPALAVVRQHMTEKFEAKLTPVMLSELDKLIRFDQRDLLLQLLDLLYELDVLISVGQVARNRGFHFARALPKERNVLHYKQVYHPHVEGAIANDLRLDQDHNILFLTGANMAGKSTLMKSIGVALYLGHMGFPVAAESLEFSVRDGIYTSINLSDNLAAGASHYYAEVLRVKEVAAELQAGRQLLVIFDELFRGTNVKDAYDATIAVTRAFTNKNGSQFIISTHIMEAGALLKGEPLSINYQFLPTEMKGNVPVYTRVLRDGITDDRQGMIIIQNEGILEMLDAGRRTAGGSSDTKKCWAGGQEDKIDGAQRFVTDKQTLTDLNLLGKYKTGSMFNLFNRVKTRGGELLLEDMFRSPLTEAAAINKRAACIQYLQGTGVTLSIDREQTESASHYLTESRPAGLLSSLFSCYKEKTQEVLYRSQAYYIQQKQIFAVQEVLLAASGLLGQLLKKQRGDHPCKGLQDRLDKIVNAPAIKKFQPKYPYSVRETAQCQYLFRNKFRHELEELLHILYEFDVYLSVAEVAEDKGLVYARAKEASDTGGSMEGKDRREVTEGKDRQVLMEVKDLRHPALSNAVGNSITLSAAENLVFLTGANMAGKSTWMKTLGVSFYLAHMGFPVGAARMSFSVMEGIFTSINVPDDLSLGWSHFYSEVMRVKVVSQAVSSGKRLFVLFDELFKGTNVKDAYDATLAVTEKLAKYRSCAFVVSTHIIEVGEALMGIPNIQFFYMPTVMKGAVPQYTYNMTPGITTDRQGMIIIENEKILEMLM